MDTIAENNFKKIFKYYKQKNPPPNFDNVIDASKIEHESYFDNVDPLVKNCELELPILPTNCNPRCEWKIVESRENPGFFILLNVFNENHSLYWIKQCLMEYTSSRYRRNIDAHFQIDSWFSEAQKPEQKHLIDKLRWSTLGYHHNWDTKEYDESLRSEFPSDLDRLCKYIAMTLQYPNYTAEAAIVNFYPGSSTLSGHTDHSEHNLGAPLISISFGQPAIFLLGGKTLDVTPTPYMLSTGSIAVMTKDVRLCYHAVPRIIIDKNQNFHHFQKSSIPTEQKCSSKSINGRNVNGNAKRKYEDMSSDNSIEIAINDNKRTISEESCDIYETENRNESHVNEELNFIIEYLKTHRINLNIRQVNFTS